VVVGRWIGLMPADQQSVHRMAGRGSESSPIQRSAVHSSRVNIIGFSQVIPLRPQAAVHILVSNSPQCTNAVPSAAVWIEIELVRNASLHGR
jgi:hypothetical protein